MWKVFGEAAEAECQRSNALERDRIHELGGIIGAEDVSLEIAGGELFVIMGLSGSGKSTIVRTLNGLIPPTSGQIIIDNVDVASCDKETLREVRRKKITMVFQHFALFPHKTIIDNVAFGLKLKGMGKEERHELARASLAKVGLEAYANSYPSQLSGGMQQRVGLARGLANDPEILLMDEPFGALDEIVRDHLNEQLLKLWAKTRKTVVFVTHSIPEAVFLSTRIVVLCPRPGRIYDVIESDLPRERTLDIRETPEFLKIAHRVREGLRAGHSYDD